MSGAGWTVLAVHCGSVDLPRAACFVGCPEDGTVQQLDFCFWLLRDGARTIVVDTSFGAEIGARRGRRLDLTPSEALDLLGVDPTAVEDVVLTHLHYDHAGNTDLFPNARFWLQRAELDFVASPEMRSRAASEHYEPENITAVRELLSAGRLTPLDGEAEIAAGISLHPVPGHTPGVQAVRAETGSGPVVAASDALHFYANDAAGLIFPVTHDAAAERAGFAKLRELAGGSDRIVAGHDPETRRRWPRALGHPNIHVIEGPPAFPMAEAHPTRILRSQKRTERR